MPRRSEGERIVWSSEPQGHEEEVHATSVSGSHSSHPLPQKQVARLSRSRRGRAGKTVIIIEGLDLPPEGYQGLAHDLRQALGTGGAVKEERIEIQGDIRDRVASFLTTHGYRVKMVGG
jgi:translation initiation factor 1